MKKLLVILFVVFGITAFAQKPKPKAGAKTKEAVVTMTKSTLINARSIRNLINVPKGCKISGYLLTIKAGGNFHEIQGKGETLSAETSAAFKHLNANQGFTIEN